MIKCKHLFQWHVTTLMIQLWKTNMLLVLYLYYIFRLAPLLLLVKIRERSGWTCSGEIKTLRKGEKTLKIGDSRNSVEMQWIPFPCTNVVGTPWRRGYELCSSFQIFKLYFPKRKIINDVCLFLYTLSLRAAHRQIEIFYCKAPQNWMRKNTFKVIGDKKKALSNSNIFTILF